MTDRTWKVNTGMGAHGLDHASVDDDGEDDEDDVRLSS